MPMSSATDLEPPPQGGKANSCEYAAGDGYPEHGLVSEFAEEAYAIRPVVLHNHDTHVVLTTLGQGGRNQCLGRCLGGGAGPQQLRDLLVIQLVVEAIAAQKQPIARAQWHVVHR